MNQAYINIACGDSYVESWCNFDYAPHSPAIRQADLLERLPVSDDTAELVYTSHFLEHVPRKQVVPFLSECFRITKSKGHVRLVLPDLEELCRTYLAERQHGKQEKADFLVLEMLDQCVRSFPGGELGVYYAHLQASPNSHVEMIEYVRCRTGHVIQSAPEGGTMNRWSRLLQNPKTFMVDLQRRYCRAVLMLLPSAFRQQNVSLAATGERHASMYDFHMVDQLLRQVGFVNVHRMTATTSNISDFPFYPLDLAEDGLPRKGAESMYIEACKP